MEKEKFAQRLIAETCFRIVAFLSWGMFGDKRRFGEFISLPVPESEDIDDSTYLVSGSRTFVYDAWSFDIPVKVRIECPCGGYSKKFEIMRQKRYRRKRLNGKCLKCGREIGAIVEFD